MNKVMQIYLDISIYVRRVAELDPHSTTQKVIDGSIMDRGQDTGMSRKQNDTIINSDLDQVGYASK